MLIGASASGYYGPRGDEIVDESGEPGSDWLAEVCVRWERATDAAMLGMRVVKIRTGIVLDADGGALAKMLPPFKAGIGGPIGSGKQYMPWIHLDDLVGLYLAAIDAQGFSGAINASAPTPVTNKEFSKALGKVLHRPAMAPVPAFVIKGMYGAMSQIVLTGVRMVPGRAAELGYEFAHPDLDEALRDTLATDAARPGPPAAQSGALAFGGPAVGGLAFGGPAFGGALALLAFLRPKSESGRDGMTSQISTARALSTRPVARPAFSP